MPSALIFGSTGAVGSQILATLVASTACTSITTISRRAPLLQDAKLKPIVEADTAKWGPLTSGLSPPPSIAYNAIGTTIASAGSVAAQWAIDHDLCVENAKAARAAGVKTYVYCSSAGTSGRFSPFALTPYAKMKRGVEAAVRDLEFESAIILRPGMILGRDKPKYKWLEEGFRGLRWFGQGVQDACGMCCFWQEVFVTRPRLTDILLCSARSNCYWKSGGRRCEYGGRGKSAGEVLGLGTS